MTSIYDLTPLIAIKRVISHMMSSGGFYVAALRDIDQIIPKTVAPMPLNFQAGRQQSRAENPVNRMWVECLHNF